MIYRLYIVILSFAESESRCSHFMAAGLCVISRSQTFNCRQVHILPCKITDRFLSLRMSFTVTVSDVKLFWRGWTQVEPLLALSGNPLSRLRKRLVLCSVLIGWMRYCPRLWPDLAYSGIDYGLFWPIEAIHFTPPSLPNEQRGRLFTL